MGTGYGPPDDGYGAPAAAYGAPSYGAETGLDLTTLIIPLLALVGLFLLFPTYVTLTSVRRKREAGEEPTEPKLVERLQDMYLAVIESEECVERIACEIGGICPRCWARPKPSDCCFLHGPNQIHQIRKAVCQLKKMRKDQVWLVLGTKL